MTTTPVPTEITRHDLLRYEPAIDGFVVEVLRGDGTRWSMRLRCWDGVSGYSVSVRSGQLYRIELTSPKGKVRGGMRAVQVWPARDTGDAAGTLAFDTTPFGGWVWAGLAKGQPEMGLA